MEPRNRSRSVLDSLKQSVSEAISLGSAAAAVTADLQGIIRSEVELAKAEMGQQTKNAARATIWIAVAAAFAYFTLLFLLVSLMFGLMEVVDQWLAALIVAGIALLITAVAALIARARFKQVRLVPERTIRTSRENVRWARNQMRLNGGSSSSAETQSQRSRTSSTS
jgi:hypothetical protein